MSDWKLASARWTARMLALSPGGDDDRQTSVDVTGDVHTACRVVEGWMDGQPGGYDLRAQLVRDDGLRVPVDIADFGCGHVAVPGSPFGVESEL